MKGIHPERTITNVHCTSCGNAFATRSSANELVRRRLLELPSRVHGRRRAKSCAALASSASSAGARGRAAAA